MAAFKQAELQYNNKPGAQLLEEARDAQYSWQKRRAASSAWPNSRASITVTLLEYSHIGKLNTNRRRYSASSVDTGRGT